MTTQYVVILATMPTNIANTLNATKYTTPSKNEQSSQKIYDLAVMAKALTDASLLMKFDGQPMGLIDVVEVPYNNQIIGWIMDVCIRPEFQGMGLGQQLIKKSLSNAYQAGFTAVGLGVTLTNKGAHQLYQNLGFEDYEIFVEILSR